MPNDGGRKEADRGEMPIEDADHALDGAQAVPQVHAANTRIAAC